MDLITYLYSAMLTITLGWVQGHSHGHMPGEEKPTGFHDPKVVQDKEHIMEHYEGKAKIDEKDMTPEELEFHYFKLHDYDNNTKLDGLEIFKALTHLVPYEPEDDGNNKKGDQAKTPEMRAKEQKDDELKYYTDIVDTVLEEDDIDNDGYLTYTEYVLARKREEAKRDEEEARKASHRGDKNSL